MKILVLGGSGFLGSHVSDELSKRGHKVTIYDTKKSTWIRKDQKMVIGNILDKKRLDSEIRKNNAVYNFAAVADLNLAIDHPVKSAEINILGTVLVLQICKKYSIKRFVHASSIYAGSSQGGFYSASKRAAEDYIREFKNLFNLDFTILRYGTVYGPRADKFNSVRNLIQTAKKKGELIYPGSKRSIRKYIHVLDAALASVKILDKKYKNKCIMLTGKKPLRVTEFLNRISLNLNIKKKTKFNKKEKYGHYIKKPKKYKIIKARRFKFNKTRNFLEEIDKILEV